MSPKLSAGEALWVTTWWVMLSFALMFGLVDTQHGDQASHGPEHHSHHDHEEHE